MAIIDGEGEVGEEKQWHFRSGIEKSSSSSLSIHTDYNNLLTIKTSKENKICHPYREIYYDINEKWIYE